MARIIDMYPDIEAQQKHSEFMENQRLLLELITYSHDDARTMEIKKASFMKNIYFYICFVFFSFRYDLKPVIG